MPIDPAIIINIEGSNTRAASQDESSWDKNYFPSFYSSDWAPGTYVGFFLGHKPNGSGGSESYLEVNTGLIGGWSLDSTKLYNDNALISSSGYISFGSTPPTSYGVDGGIWVGYSTDVAKASFINSDGSKYLKWTGSDLEIRFLRYSDSLLVNIAKVFLQNLQLFVTYNFNRYISRFE